MQLMKELMKPARLYHAVGHGTVLCLNTRMGDIVLALQGLRDKVVVQEHRVAQSGLASVGTTRPVSVSVEVLYPGYRGPPVTT
jgi:hypothetical protein